MRILALVFAFIGGPTWAHELWLEPTAFQIAPDGRLVANIVNGEEFQGTKQAFLPRNIANFIVSAGDEIARVEGRVGDTPALNQAPVAEGLNIAAYQARNATVNYKEFAKFLKFAAHKDLGDVGTRHQARGLPMDGFDEVYSRYSKSLIAVGDGQGADERLGMETELVALMNPYTDDLSEGFAVQLHYRDMLRANEQIEVFEKAPGGKAVITTYRTDENGIGRFPVKPGHIYMVDAVVLREPSAQLQGTTGAVWQTLWANLTFATP